MCLDFQELSTLRRNIKTSVIFKRSLLPFILMRFMFHFEAGHSLIFKIIAGGKP